MTAAKAVVGGCWLVAAAGNDNSLDGGYDDDNDDDHDAAEDGDNYDSVPDNADGCDDDDDDHDREELFGKEMGHHL